jgi:hypothetical protein
VLLFFIFTVTLFISSLPVVGYGPPIMPPATNDNGSEFQQSATQLGQGQTSDSGGENNDSAGSTDTRFRANSDFSHTDIHSFRVYNNYRNIRSAGWGATPLERSSTSRREEDRPYKSDTASASAVSDTCESWLIPTPAGARAKTFFVAFLAFGFLNILLVILGVLGAVCLLRATASKSASFHWEGERR